MVVPVESAIVILPRAAPVPAVRSWRSVSVARSPFPISKESLVRPSGVVSVSVKPLESF